MMYSLYIILSFWRSGPALQYGAPVTMLQSRVYSSQFECTLGYIRPVIAFNIHLKESSLIIQKFQYPG